MSDAHASTRQAYDIVAADYARALDDDLDTNIWDRAVLSAFTEHIAEAGGGQVLDAGCGPGRITGHLHELGLEISGLDLSPAMVTEARWRFPALSFRVGRLDALDVVDGSLAGLLAWYSLIHVPPRDRLSTLGVLATALRPGGYLQLAFQVGDGHRLITDAYGHRDLQLDAWRLDVEQVSNDLRQVGLDVAASVVRAPEHQEHSAQAYVLARKPSP